MKKSLRRVLERLRDATSGKFRPAPSVRGGLQEPQRMQAELLPAHSVARS